MRLEERDADVHFIERIRKEDELQAKLLGPVDEPPARDLSEPVRRIVVYLDRPPDGESEEPEPERVTGVAPGELPQPVEAPTSADASGGLGDWLRTAIPTDAFPPA